MLQECHDPPSHVTMNTQITKHMCNYQATWKIIIAAIRPYKQSPTLYHGMCMSFLNSLPVFERVLLIVLMIVSSLVTVKVNDR